MILDETNGGLYWDTACEKCGLCKTRRKVVVGRGFLPCHLFLVGEAPGKSEDLCGVPFIGPSGKLLTQAMSEGMKMAGKLPPLKTFTTNVIACRPPENREPTAQEALACWPRLVRLYNAANPVMVVHIGKEAAKYVKKLPAAGVLVRTIAHPAYILRNGGVSGPLWPGYARGWADILTAAHEACNSRRNMVD